MWKLPENLDTYASYVFHQRIKAISIGSFANQRLKQSQFAKVSSIFDRSLYLDFNGDWICVANAELGRSPITINLNQKFAKGWLKQFKIGKLVEISPFGFYMDNYPIIALKALNEKEEQKSFKINELIDQLKK